MAQLAQHLGLTLRDIKIVAVNGRQHQVDDPMPATVTVLPIFRLSEEARPVDHDKY